ncbi:putative peptidase S8 [Halomicronema hongdechloris C2206]|uniref:Peptidase S8 n=1 Tax=Halomicronema hongdechloris C2206 TaxID=1641165 RepID=A0A1Z3HVL5_9CYAN|nr:S8 family peptidase [Halomicronema hongdechloris]ASC74339.1 putative peptidase S8 [Halomicronema hongdechloris C2206]
MNFSARSSNPIKAGEVIIKFKSGASLAGADQLQNGLQASVLATASGDALQLWQIDGMTTAEAIAAYQDHPLVEYIEPNAIYTLQGGPTNTPTTPPLPNDPDLSDQWGLHNTGQTGGIPDVDIDAPEAWQQSTGNTVVVGVIDSGIDYTHPDLNDNMWINAGEIAGNGLDDDGNGYVDDVYGYDFINNDSDPIDDNSHGTHVAGTIAAETNNGIGVAGVAPDAQLMALKIFDAAGTTTTFAITQAIEYATLMGADLTNNSWGGSSPSQAIYDAIAAAGAADQLFIAAAGNGGLDGIGDNNDLIPHYPSNYDLDNIIAVAATDHTDQLGSFSNYGATSVDLAAPGVDILSTIPGGYASFSGTSMATPHVAGVAAQVLSQDPSLSFQEVKQAILDGVDPVAALTGKTVTGGRLNAFNALNPGTTPSDNLSFEFGDFTGWSTLGATTIETDTIGVGPTDGTYQALLTNGSGSVDEASLESFLGLNPGSLDVFGNGNVTTGSALKLAAITVQAGDLLSFDWNFLTNELTPSSFNDFGFFTISDAFSGELADTQADFVSFGGSGFSNQTGYGTFNYIFAQDGTYDIGLGVVDEGDSSVNSGLLVDNFALLDSQSLNNWGFEVGNLTGWRSLGDTSVVTNSFGANPTEGQYQALVTTADGAAPEAALESFLGLQAGALDAMGNGDVQEGSAIEVFSFQADAGDTLSFDWSFLTNEATPSPSFNDFGFVVIDSQFGGELADTGSDVVSFGGADYANQTGYDAFTYEFTQTGVYNVAIGVADVGDTSVNSALLIDNLDLINSSLPVSQGRGGAAVSNQPAVLPANQLLVESPVQPQAPLDTLIDITGQSSLSFELTRESASDNLLSFYLTDSQGGIEVNGQTVLPGQAGYDDAVRERLLDVQWGVDDGASEIFELDLDTLNGQYLAPAMLTRGNSNKLVTLADSLQSQGRWDHSGNSWGFEDWSDFDYNDLVLTQLPGPEAVATV